MMPNPATNVINKCTMGNEYHRQPNLIISPFFSSAGSSSPSALSSSSSSRSMSGSGVGGGTSSSWLLELSTSTFCCSSCFSFFILRPLLGVGGGGGGDGLLTLVTIGGAARFAAGADKLGPFLAAAGWPEGGGVSERENETAPVLERVAGDSLSLEKREGGAGFEPEGWGTAKEWLWVAEVEEDDEGWGCEALPFEELWRCASSMAVLTSGWLAWCFSRWRANER